MSDVQRAAPRDGLSGYDLDSPGGQDSGPTRGADLDSQGAQDSRPTPRADGNTLGSSALPEAVAARDRAWPQVPGYEILGIIGRGGMGVVYKARHLRLKRIVALKVIVKENLSANADAIRRFHREARAAAQLFHPNVVVLFDSDEADDICFIAMEYVDGVDLHQLVKERGPLPIDVACDYVRQASLGLQHAFEAGLVHRDIKPSNLLVALPSKDVVSGGTIKILDMGLALAAHSPDAPQYTQQGALMGTPDYIAPEQALDSHGVDIRADLYSLGCTFYYLLAGRAPFGDQPLLRKLMMHQTTEPRPVQELRSDVPPAIAAVVRKLLKKQPEERFQTPAELIAALGGSSSPPLPSAASRPTAPVPTPEPRTPTSEASVSTLVAAATQEVLPEGVQRPEKIVVLEGHRGCVTALAFSHDRKVLLSGAVDGGIRRWDMSSSKKLDLALPANHAADIAAIAWSADDRLIASSSGSAGDLVTLWDNAGEQPIVKASMPSRDTTVEALVFAPSGALLAGGGSDHQVRIWDVSRPTSGSKFVLKGHADTVKALAFGSDSQTLASGSEDGTVRIWNLGRRIWSKEQSVLPGDWGPIRTMAFSPNQALLAFGGIDKTVRLWDHAGERLAVLKGHAGGIRLVAFNHNGEMLLTVCDSGQVILWKLESLAREREWMLPRGVVYPSLAVTHDGRYLAAGDSTGGTSLFRLYSRRDRKC